MTSGISVNNSWIYDDPNGTGETQGDLKPAWNVASPATDAVFGTACVGAYYSANYYDYLVKYFVNGTKAWTYYMPGGANFAFSGVASLPGGAALFAAQDYNNGFIRFQLVTPSGATNGSYWDFTSGSASLYLASMATATSNATVWVVGNRVVGANSSIFLLKVNPYTHAITEFDWEPSAIVHAGRCVSDGVNGLYVTGFNGTSPWIQLLVAHFTATGTCIQYTILSNATEQLGSGIDYNGREVVVVGFRGTGVTNYWNNYAWAFDSSLNLIRPILLNGTTTGLWNPETITRDHVIYLENTVLFPDPASNNFVATCMEGTNSYNTNPSIDYWDDASQAITASFFDAIDHEASWASGYNLARTWDSYLFGLGQYYIPYSDNMMSRYIKFDTTFPVTPFRPLYIQPSLFFNPVNGNSPQFYLPVTLVNSEGMATPANFQARVSINSNANSMYYASDLANVNWQDGNGAIMNSWLESGNSNAAAGSVYWINLGALTIPAEGSMTIYQVIYATTVIVLNTNNAGEAPQLSSPYGHFDNGASVFSFYDNFTGTSLSSKWVNNTATSGGSITVNNGVTIGIETSYNSAAQLYSAANLNGPLILDLYGTIPGGLTAGSWSTAMIGVADPSPTNLNRAVVGYNCAAGGGYVFDTTQGTGTSNVVAGLGGWGTNTIYSILLPSTGAQSFASAEYNYGGMVTSSSDLPTLPQPIIFIAQLFGANLGPFNWARTRTYTANDIMPTTSFGSMVNASKTVQSNINSDQTGDEWPMYRGALDHAGVATTTPVQAEGALWSFPTGSYLDSSPVVTGEYLYVGSSNYRIYCLNTTTGGLLWSYTTGSYYVEGTPAVAGNRVYVGSADDKLYCLDATTGAFLWSYTTGGYVYSSPAVANGHVYVGSYDHKVYCLNASTGVFIWSYNTGNLVSSSPAVIGDRVYVGSWDDNVYCLNATTGGFLWSYSTGATVTSSPAVAGGLLYVGSEDDKMYCLNATTGALRWSYTTGNYVYSSPAVVNDRVYVGSWDDNVYCLNATTGGFLWSYTTGFYVQSSPAVACGLVYVGSEDSKVYCLDATTGAFIWSYATGEVEYSSPAVAGGRVYVGSMNQNVYCLPMILQSNTTVPGAPQSLTAKPGNAQVVLNWTAPASNGGSAITGYRIYRGTTSGGEVLLATIGNMTTYTATSLTNGQVYYFEVAAMNGMGVGLRSNEALATPATVPGAPTLTTATLGNMQVFLAWAAPASNGGSAITGYNVYQGTYSGGETLLVSLGVVLTYTSTGLVNGQIYYFEVAAINVIGVGAKSNELSAWGPEPMPPSSPQAIAAYPGNAQVVLSWAAPASNGGSPITGYDVYQGTTSGGEVLLASLGIVLTYTSTGLSNGQVYYFQVAAMNMAGTSARTMEATATPLTVPGAPIIMGGSGWIWATQDVLTWVAPASNGDSAITGYDVYQGTTSGGETLLATIGNVTTYTVTGLTYGQTYYFKVAAVNFAGPGANSTEINATPMHDALPPGPPQELTATPASNFVVLNWVAPVYYGGPALTGYNVYQGTTSGGEVLVANLGVVLTDTITGLTNGQVYYFEVTVVNMVGEGPKSNEANATPSASITPPGAPQALTATPVNTQVLLRWAVPASNGESAITGYRVFQGTTSGGETLLATISNVTTCTSTGLTNGQTYYFTIQAVNVMGPGMNSTEASATPVVTVPDAPGSFTVQPGPTQVVLNWAVPPSNGGLAIAGYKVYQGTTSGGETLLATIGNLTTYMSTNLTNGQVYYFKVVAVNVMNITGVNSTEANATPATAPAVPTGLTATAGNAQVILNWLPPVNNSGLPITNYKVRVGWGPFTATIGNVTTFTVTGLTNGQLYYFEVAAVNSGGVIGANSTAASATPATVPTAPTGLTATAENAQVVLNWVAPASNGGSAITRYTVYQGTTSGGEAFLTTLGIVLTYTVTGLTNGQAYYFEIAAVNVMGTGARSNQQSTTPAVAVPGAPTGLTLTPGTTQIVLVWTAPASTGGSPITGYNVYRGTTSGGETLLANLGVVLTYTATGLTNGQIYYLEVTAVNALGEGARSNELSATPCTIPGAPTLSSATAGNAQVVLVWIAPGSNGGSPITGYNVYRGTTSGGETLLANLGVVLTYTATGLTNDQIYYFEVTAVNLAGESARSNELSATPYMVPGAPTLSSATPGNAQVVLVWSAPGSNGGSAITGYNVYRGTTSGGETLLLTIGNVTTYTSSGLTNDQIYYFEVAAKNTIGFGPRSNEASATPLVTTTITVTSPTGGSFVAGCHILVTWTTTGSISNIGVSLYKSNGQGVYGYETYGNTGNYSFWIDPTIGEYFSIPGLYYFTVWNFPDATIIATSSCFTITPAPPSITQPPDITYYQGTTGNNISWTVTETGTGTKGYTIYRNGTSIATGSWTSGTPVTIVIDGLSIGIYNYTIVAFYNYNATISYSVQDPVIASVILPTMPTSTSSDQVGDEWPMFRGALNHTGVVMTTPVQGAGPTWNYTTGNGTYSSPTVMGGCVYVGSADHNVYCLNATTGARIWKFTTGGYVESAPAVAGNRVYVGSWDHKIYCLYTTNGTLAWSYTTGGEVDISSPAVADGCVYVGSLDGKVYCLDAITGSSIWNFTTGNWVESSPAIADGRVYVGSNDHNLYCLCAITGFCIWNYTTGNIVDSSPAVMGLGAFGRVYVGSDDDKVYCLNASSGTLIWSYTTGGTVDSSPAVAGGLVYVGSGDGKVYCLSASSGTKIWSSTIGGAVSYSSPAVVGGCVYVGSQDGNMYCLNATTGARVWNYTTGLWIFSSPAVAGGHVYVWSGDGNVYCLPMVLGSQNILPVLTLVFSLQGRIFSNPVHLTINITYGEWPVQQAWCIVDQSTTYVLTRINGTALSGFYSASVNLTSGSHVLMFFVNDTHGNTKSLTITITVIKITPPPNDSTIIVIIVVFIIGVAIGVAIPLAYNRYKYRSKQKKPTKLKAGTYTQSMDKVAPEMSQEPDKRSRLLAASIPTASQEQPYLGVKVAERCTLHKGLIVGPSYTCKNCGAVYCIACTKQLIETGENCWTCGTSIDSGNILDNDQQGTITGENKVIMTVIEPEILKALDDLYIGEELKQDFLQMLKEIPPEKRLQFLDDMLKLDIPDDTPF